MNVSLFKNINDVNNGHQVGIVDVFDAIQTGQWMSHVETVRNATSKDHQKVLKKSVPYFTASGTFQHRRDDGLISHSGIIAIDFDNLDNVKETKSWLACDRFSWFTCESISGNGLCVFVKIDSTKHLESFKYLESYYLTNYQLAIDPACKDISRPRFVTYDPDGYLNPNAERLEFERESQFDPERIFGIAENMIRNSRDGERHFGLLKASRLMGGYVGSGLMDEIDCENRLASCWVERECDPSYNFKETISDGIGYGKNSPITIEHFKEKIKESAENKKQIAKVFKIVREINRAGRSWDHLDVISICESLFLNKQKVEQIFKQVFDEEKHLHGFDDKPKFVQTEIVIADKWEFRQNIVTQSIDYRVRLNPKDQFKPVNFDTVSRFAQHCGMVTSVDKIKSLLRSDFVPEYDPLKSYFLNLPEWDKKRDYISEFANHVSCEDQQFWMSMFKKHLVRSVAQIMEHRVNRFVLVLVGEKQSTGKSTFVRYLSPFPMGEYYTESKVRDDKDGQFAFAENFIYNIEELSDMGNADVNRLKAIISQAIIKERKPYAHDVKPVVRRCTFFGSTNNAQFLTDTENTRWLCHSIKNINWNYTKIDIHDIWSQAFSLYISGFNDQLETDENEFQAKQNKNFEVSDIGKEIISKYFKVCSRTSPESEFMTVADVFQYIMFMTDSKVKINERIVGKNMIQLGFEKDRKRVNSSVVRGYYVHKIAGAYVPENENEVVQNKMF